MRCTLRLLLITIAVVMVGTGVQAGGVNWSVGATLTEKESGIQIGSRIEASRNGRLIGSWFSSSGQLPVIVEGLDCDAFGDFPAIRNIQKVVLSPDHGKTEWPAEQIEGKGYRVVIPHLPAGSYGLEWGVRSRDKNNRLMLIIIPINWTSHRSTGATNHAMVQRPPLGSENFSDQQWFACLRGFVSAWASLDPAFMAQQQMVSQQAPVQPQTTVQPPPSHGVMTSPHYRLEAQPPQVPPTSSAEEIVRVEPMYSEIMMVLNGNDVRELPVTIHADLAKGDRLIFKRNGRFVAEAAVTRTVPGKYVEARILKGGGVRANDQIFLKGAK